MSSCSIFRDAAVRHLGILKVGNFNCPYHSECQNALHCQILCRSVEPLQRYSRFSIFQDGGHPPSWIYQKWPTHREPNLAHLRNWQLVVTSNSGPKLQKWCLWNNLNNHGVSGDQERKGKGSVFIQPLTTAQVLCQVQSCTITLDRPRFSDPVLLSKIQVRYTSSRKHQRVYQCC